MIGGNAYESKRNDYRIKGKVMQYVELLPTASKDPEVDGFETNVNSKTGVQVITYHTNNEHLFWQHP